MTEVGNVQTPSVTPSRVDTNEIRRTCITNRRLVSQLCDEIDRLVALATELRKELVDAEENLTEAIMRAW